MAIGLSSAFFKFWMKRTSIDVLLSRGLGWMWKCSRWGTDERTLKVLTEKEVISIDQDAAGIPEFRCMKVRDLETWVKPLAKGEWAICFLNRGSDPQKHEIDREEMFNAKIGMKKGTYSVRNIWEKNDIGTTKNKLTVNVQAVGVILLGVKPVD